MSKKIKQNRFKAAPAEPVSVRFRGLGRKAYRVLAFPVLICIFSLVAIYAHDAVVADLTRWSPALIFVDVREDKDYFGGLPFDYIAYFSEDPRFAQIWSRYELFLDFGTYHLYRRRPTPH